MNIEELMKEYSGIRLDIGCGANKQPGFVGMDVRALPGVDIVWDCRRMPWPLPDGSVLCAVSSHLVEHISPDAGDHRVELLVNLLVQKRLLEPDEVLRSIGEVESKPRFIRFMDEVWRVLRPGGEFAIACPHGYSPGFLQDPTHCNEISEATFAYFDPEQAGGGLYSIYRPKPWKLKALDWSPAANIEAVMVKRPSTGSGSEVESE